jgi:hypothetical protein
MPTFKKAALVYATHSTWGGWHHVEVHETDWWIARFQSFGFVYSDSLTNQVRNAAMQHRLDVAPDNSTYNAQHIWLHMMVFVNPVVASLEKHHHLLAEIGCYSDYTDNHKRPCGTFTVAGGSEKQTAEIETPLPPEYEPLHLTEEMDRQWEQTVFAKTSRMEATS